MNGTERIAMCRLRLSSPLFLEDESEEVVDARLSIFMTLFVLSGTALLFWPIGWRWRGLSLLAALSLLNWKLDATTVFWKLEGLLLALALGLTMRCGGRLLANRHGILGATALALLLAGNVPLCIAAVLLLALSLGITAVIKRKRLAIVHFAGAHQLKRQREEEKRILAQGFSLASATVEKVLLPSGGPSHDSLGWTADRVQLSMRDGKEQPVLEFSPAEDMVVFYSVANSFLKQQTFVAYYYGRKKCTFPPLPLQEYQKKSYRSGSSVIRSFFYSAGRIQELPPLATKFLAQCLGPRQAPRSGGASPNSSPTAGASSPLDSLMDAHFGHAWTFERLVHFGVLKPTQPAERKERKSDEEEDDMPHSFLLQLITNEAEKAQIEAAAAAIKESKQVDDARNEDVAPPVAPQVAPQVAPREEKKDESIRSKEGVVSLGAAPSAVERFLVTSPEPELGPAPCDLSTPSPIPLPPPCPDPPLACPTPSRPLSVRAPSPAAPESETEAERDSDSAEGDSEVFLTLGSPIWQDQFLYRSRPVRSNTADPVAKQFMQRYRQISAPSYIAANGRAGVLVQISSSSKEIIAIPGL